MSPPDDLIVKNVRVVRPGAGAPVEADIAVRDGKFSRIAPNLSPADAKEVYDGKGRLAFPGVVDAHPGHGGFWRLGHPSLPPRPPRNRAQSPQEGLCRGR